MGKTKLSFFRTDTLSSHYSPLLTYRATGRFDVKSPNCNIYKALFPGVLHLEALRLLRYEEPIALGEARKVPSL